MRITIRELLENLKHYPVDTEIVIEDVDDQEFAIVDFQYDNNKLMIVIGEKQEAEKQE